MAEPLPELLVPNASAWRKWLDKHHEEAGVWLVLAKKGTTKPTSITYDEALDEATCFGWIDGQNRRRDDSTYFQRFTPRSAKSNWSPGNVERVKRLTEEKRMHASGLAAFKRRVKE